MTQQLTASPVVLRARTASPYFTHPKCRVYIESTLRRFA
jgi:hypothetical protein